MSLPVRFAYPIPGQLGLPARAPASGKFTLHFLPTNTMAEVAVAAAAHLAPDRPRYAHGAKIFILGEVHEPADTLEMCSEKLSRARHVLVLVVAPPVVVAQA